MVLRHSTGGGGPSQSSRAPRKILRHGVTTPSPPPKTSPTIPAYSVSGGQLVRRQVTLEFGDTHEGKALRIPYGLCRFSPLAVHVEIPTGSCTLWLVYSLGEGEIDSIQSVLYNGTQIFDGSNNLVSWASCEQKWGTTSQTAFTDPPPSWPASTHPGHALLKIKVNLASDKVPGGQPDLEVIIKGRRLYDFRTSTTAWSDNPILIAYDLLTNTEFGAGVSPALLDIAGSWTAAANRCDETVNGQHRWRACTVLLDRQPVTAIIADLLLATCAGILYNADGLWYVDLDEQHVVGCRPALTTAVGTYDRAQSFVAPGPRIKPTIKLDLAVGFTNPTLRLRSTLAGADLVTFTATGLSAGTGQEINFDLSSYKLTVGATYYLVLTLTTGVTWHRIGSDVYSGGTAWYNNAGWIQEAAADLWTQVHFVDFEIADQLLCTAGQIPILASGAKSSLSFTRARNEAPNVCIVTYYDVTSWQQVEIRYEGAAFKAGTEQARELRTQMLAVPAADPAYRLARQWYLRSQRTLHVGVTVPQHGIQIAPLDVVSLSSAIGPLANVWFSVQSVQRSFGQFLLELVPYVWTDYSREETAYLDTITIPNAAGNLQMQLLKDDFTRGSAVSLDIGEQGWRLVSGTVGYSSEQDHNGIVSLTNSEIRLDQSGQMWAEKSAYYAKYVARLNCPNNTNQANLSAVFLLSFVNSAGTIGLSVGGVATGTTWTNAVWLTIEVQCDGGGTAYLTVTQGAHVYSTSKVVSGTTMSQYLDAAAMSGGTVYVDIALVTIGRAA